VPTFNRADLLAKALETLARQSLPRDQYEVIVVDNNSTDDTRQVVDGLRHQMPNLRYLFEAEQGVSAARNRGWQAAAAPLVAFQDDDALAGPDWLEQYLRAFASQSPAPGCVGGRIEPIWESPRPAWLPDALLWCYSVLDQPGRPVILQGPVFPPAANLAFQRRVLERLGGFTLSMGRRNGKLLSGEETLVIRQMLRLGPACLFWPQASVRHLVSTGRLNVAWLTRRMYWEGVSCAISRRQLEPMSRRRRLRLAVHALWRIAQSPNHRRALFTRRHGADVTPKVEAWGCVGEAVGLLGLAG
jgi:glycosyltransferase involved in cell wall biosynthesis